MLFDTLDGLQQTLASGEIFHSVDDVWLLQERIETTDAFITRVEFIGGRFHYAVRVFGRGSFEVCPADVCEVPADDSEAAAPRFEIDLDFDDPLIDLLDDFLAANGIEVAGVEFIGWPDGTVEVYDVNTNTNHNGQAETRAGVKAGMHRITEFLTGELTTISPQRRARHS